MQASGNQMQSPKIRRRQEVLPASTPNATAHLVPRNDNDRDVKADVTAPSLDDSPTYDSGNLSRFFEAGVLSSKWDAFEEKGTFRDVYIGTEVANLHHLVRDHELPGSGCLFYPCPAIRDELSWKPAPGPSIHHYLSDEALSDLSSSPVRHVLDALVETYFADIHPGFPIIDQANFRRRYEDADNPPPLIVFQAMLLAAARITDHPQVAASRETTTAVLYKRAKTLFDLRHEHDRVDLIQAALLMSWYVESSDTVASNAYYWVGSAVRIAFGMGLHRTASLREVMLALEYGRPSLIRIDDFDVGVLEDDDFKNMDDSDDHTVNGYFCSILGDISMVSLDILSLRAPRGRPAHLTTSATERQLSAVAMRILPTHDAWSCQLRLIYNRVVLAFHRTSHDESAAKLCSEAASNILTTFEAMVVHSTIRQCHLSTTTALTAAAIEFAREARSAAATGSILKAISAHGQLERLLGPAEALSPHFSHVKAVHRLCKSLSARAEVLIKEAQEPNSTLPVSQLPPETNIDWEGIMANYRTPNLGFGTDLEGEEWLHAFSWANADPSYDGTE
ncbi:uncharacterized protein A1O9_12735 [Exophiala aquamarina CBS 119918]|uniref:Xylanolytic transcriptional activator regulatory domain-containing protein n=1 Tax=Exophiala aquamarina CBS 119918 TaxID=1182545 RepID=A0A072NV32_9EURO|nr:uncharacterized protein A1O9_12735 [Exophiala aquamarina CBS 119918]KEF51232.1 hypothetical protein A1O9_12735 [Exophiala aquamarina CBS 119918]